MADYDNRKVAHRFISPEARFEILHEKTDSGCWIWKGSPTGSNGYGRILVNGRHIQAHRYSYEKNFGEIPDGMFVLHKCDVPLCVNPDHLFLGTIKDNSDDKVNKNRQAKGIQLSIAQNNSKRKGSLNANSRLKESDVISIYKDQRAQRKIAEEYKITQATVYSIKKQRSWTWLTKTI